MLTIHQQFSQPLLTWFDAHGRKNLPWKTPLSPYRVWLSEIMLQQTQVQTVIPYFNAFISQLPTLEALANADEDKVLALWSGLGYYSRARNLHSTAKIIQRAYQGRFPEDSQLLMGLPGIGPSTAAAITSQAFNQPTAILDANVKRVLARFFLVEGWPEHTLVKKKLWELARYCMPTLRCADYTQAIMDLGATCCRIKNPQCPQCPLKTHCQAEKLAVQASYPSKKIKKAIPTQHKQLLVLRNQQGFVYLEKRPPTGIWGGLWCLPSIDLDESPLTYINHAYNLQGEGLQLLTAFKHSFSHFHLAIKAFVIETRPLSTALAEPTGLWYAKEQLQGLGLAKPTRTILEHL